MKSFLLEMSYLQAQPCLDSGQEHTSWKVLLLHTASKYFQDTKASLLSPVCLCWCVWQSVSVCTWVCMSALLCRWKEEVDRSGVFMGAWFTMFH